MKSSPFWLQRMAVRPRRLWALRWQCMCCSPTATCRKYRRASPYPKGPNYQSRFLREQFLYSSERTNLLSSMVASAQMESILGWSKLTFSLRSSGIRLTKRFSRFQQAVICPPSSALPYTRRISSSRQVLVRVTNSMPAEVGLLSGCWWWVRGWRRRAVFSGGRAWETGRLSPLLRVLSLSSRKMRFLLLSNSTCRLISSSGSLLSCRLSLRQRMLSNLCRNLLLEPCSCSLVSGASAGVSGRGLRSRAERMASNRSLNLLESLGWFSMPCQCAEEGVAWRLRGRVLPVDGRSYLLIYILWLGRVAVVPSHDKSTAAGGVIIVVLFMMDERDQLESIHRLEVKSAFSNYSRDVREENACLFNNVTSNEFYRQNQQRKALMLDNALRHNQAFLDQIIAFINTVEEEDPAYVPNQETSRNNRSKIKTTLKQFFREWCGQSVEKEDYVRMAEKCKQYLSEGDLVLVPGCGLGRLVFELVRAGFGAEGNELTYFMLFGSNFIINCTDRKQQFTLFPFVSSNAYYYNEEDAYRSVTIPDLAPSEEITGETEFNITGGEFTFVYSKRPQHFQGVASCFFLDTANNIFDYVNTIWTTLKPNGIWINFGPLLFHYKEMLGEVSIEVSWETLKAYIQNCFQFLEEGFRDTTYCHDPKGDLTVVYNCISFVCRKKQPETPLHIESPSESSQDSKA